MSSNVQLKGFPDSAALANQLSFNLPTVPVSTSQYNVQGTHVFADAPSCISVHNPGVYNWLETVFFLPTEEAEKRLLWDALMIKGEWDEPHPWRRVNMWSERVMTGSGRLRGARRRSPAHYSLSCAVAFFSRFVSKHYRGLVVEANHKGKTPKLLVVVCSAG